MPETTPQEIQQLQRQLDKMELRLFERYCEAGKSLLEIAERENRQIDKLVDAIIETRRHIALAGRNRRCEACATVNDQDSRYCKHCGRHLDDNTNREETSL